MTRPQTIAALIATLALGLACAAPALPMSEESFNTLVAQTVEAALTEKYVSPTVTPTPSVTPTFTQTFTPQPPTPTEFPTETLTPTFPYTPTSSPTSEVPPPKLIVAVNTNCRAGPDKSFRVEGTLLKGETTTVHGIDSSGAYWYVRNPDPGAEYCWLSGKYAVVSGAVSMLPVYTPQPTPTLTPTITPIPDFNLKFYNLDSCNTWWVNLELVNKGGLVFESILIKMVEPQKGRELTLSSNDFIYQNGCAKNSIAENSLKPGASVTVSSPQLGYNPTGKKLAITVWVCSEEDGNGLCLSENLTFKP